MSGFQLVALCFSIWIVTLLTYILGYQAGRSAGEIKVSSFDADEDHPKQ